MQSIYNQLKDIERQNVELGKSMHKEEQVYRAEQEERYRLGLHGADAIKHYNEWMKHYDMEHLMIKEE